MFATRLVLALCALVSTCGFTCADEPRPTRVLLLSQKPDGHPPTTHEYVAGLRVLEACLSKQPGIQAVPVRADGDWEEGPDLLDGADGAVLYLAEGAKWMSASPSRMAAFQKFGKDGKGLAVLHWAMGTRTAEPIKNFTNLFGACHGGPDRKYKVLEAVPKAGEPHPTLTGVEFAPAPFQDEYYYALKRSRTGTLKTLISVAIDGEDQMVAWAFSRDGGGRSFGFSGLHFHANWELPATRRFVTQGVLWTLGREIPASGVSVDVPEDILELQSAQPPATGNN